MNRFQAAFLLASLLAASCAPPPRKVLLLGLDSATMTVLDPMVRAGELPTFGRFFREGSTGRLATFKPTLSVVIWTTIMTGEPHEEHGIHGWLNNSGDQFAFSSDLIKRPPLWRILSHRCLPGLYVNFWASWPVERIDGAMISNRMRFDGLRARAWPPSLEQRLDRMPKPISRPKKIHDPNHPFAGKVFYEQDRYALALAKEALAHMSPRFVAIYLRGLDIAQHRLWYTVDETALGALEGDDQGTVKGYYRYLDKALAELLRVYPADAVVVVSDHGMEALHEIPPVIVGLNLNRLLERMGLLAFLPRKKAGRIRPQEIMFGATKVFEYGGRRPDLHRELRLNLEGREPEGIVSPAEKESLLDGIAARLRALQTETACSLFSDVQLVAKGTAASGQASPAGSGLADLVMDLNPEVDWGDVLLDGEMAIPIASLGHPILLHNSGQHDNAPPGIILMQGRGIRRGATIADATVFDVAPTVLSLLGLPAAADMAGRPLADALTFQPPAPVKSYTNIPYLGEASEGKTGADRELFKDLRSLGYVR